MLVTLRVTGYMNRGHPVICNLQLSSGSVSPRLPAAPRARQRRPPCTLPTDAPWRPVHTRAHHRPRRVAAEQATVPTTPGIAPEGSPIHRTGRARTRPRQVVSEPNTTAGKRLEAGAGEWRRHRPSRAAQEDERRARQGARCWRIEDRGRDRDSHSQAATWQPRTH